MTQQQHPREPVGEKAADTGSRQLVVFSLGDEEYGLPITDVQEIIRYTEPRTIASDVPWITGVISLRGKIVPVCDLATRLGLGARTGADAKIVIVEAGAATAGVVVDDVREVLTVEASQIEPVPAATGDGIEAIVKVDDRLVVLLDGQGVLGDVQLAA